jgi:hypothetical protein
VARPTRRNARQQQQQQQMGLGDMFVDFLKRKMMGQSTPRGHYGPVDEELVASLKRRLAAAEHGR